MGSDESRASALRQELASLRRSRHWLAAVEVARELTDLEPEDGDSWFWLARAREHARSAGRWRLGGSNGAPRSGRRTRLVCPAGQAWRCGGAGFGSAVALW